MAAPSWSLERSDDGIFLFLNGGRAVDTEGNEFGPLEYIDYGRTATELWVSINFYCLSTSYNNYIIIIIYIEYRGLFLFPCTCPMGFKCTF